MHCVFSSFGVFPPVHAKHLELFSVTISLSSQSIHVSLLVFGTCLPMQALQASLFVLSLISLAAHSPGPKKTMEENCFNWFQVSIMLNKGCQKI